MQRIASRQNALVAQFREAARGRSPLMLLDGSHLVGDAIGAGITIRHVLVADDLARTQEVNDVLDRLPSVVHVASASASVMDTASPVRSKSGIIALADRPVPRVSPFSGGACLVVIACDVQDPGNVGAIIRVAEGAGASGVVVAGHTADPYGWKALRGSMGSTLRLPVIAMPTIDAAVSEARRHGARIIATVPRRGRSPFASDLTGSMALLVGGEGPGLPEAIIDSADERLTIPMESPVESLNVAVAAAVLLYEARRQRAHRAPTHEARSVPDADGLAVS